MDDTEHQVVQAGVVQRGLVAATGEELSERRRLAQESGSSGMVWLATERALADRQRGTRAFDEHDAYCLATGRLRECDGCAGVVDWCWPLWFRQAPRTGAQ
jgi:hypothetical protein